MFVSHHTLKWTRTCRSHGRHPHAHTAHFLLNRHTWVEVYQDGRWVGLDPTHNRLVDDSYITIAHGRDYRDCMLDIGIFSGYNVQQSQWVNASVHEQVA